MWRIDSSGPDAEDRSPMLHPADLWKRRERFAALAGVVWLQNLDDGDLGNRRSMHCSEMTMRFCSQLRYSLSYEFEIEHLLLDVTIPFYFRIERHNARTWRASIKRREPASVQTTFTVSANLYVVPLHLLMMIIPLLAYAPRSYPSYF